MASSGMLCRVALVRTDVSEELTRATRRNIPEDNIIKLFDLMLEVLAYFQGFVGGIRF
jgi:hypothetical protein